MTFRFLPLAATLCLAAPLAAQPTYIPPPPIPGNQPPIRMPQPPQMQQVPQTPDPSLAPDLRQDSAELIDWFKILRFRVDKLEERVEALEAENARLKQAAGRYFMMPENCTSGGVVAGASLGMPDNFATTLFPNARCRD